MSTIHEWQNTASDFANDDYIGVDGENLGSRKMSKDSLLKLTSQNAIKNIVPEFSSANTYAVGNLVTKDGTLYKCTTAHSGNWNSQHFTETTVDELFERKDVVATLQSEMTTAQADISKLYGMQTRFTTSDGLNAIIKELFIDPNDISTIQPNTIVKCRVFNGYSGLYGLNFYDASNNSKLPMYSENDTVIRNYRRSYALVDISSIPEGEYRDFTDVSLTDLCNHLDFSPGIIEYLYKAFDAVNFTSLYIANSYVKELYLDPSDVSDVDLVRIAKVRVYNGYNNRYGVNFADSEGNVVFNLYTSTASTLQISSKSGVALDYRTLTNSTYRDYECTLDVSKVRNLSLSPSVKSEFENRTLTTTLNKASSVIKRFTDNDGLNTIVKELYIDSADVSVVEPQNITKCRVYNGYVTGGGETLYGATFYDSSNNAKLELKSSTNSPLQNYRSSYGVFDLSSVVNGTYKDFFTPELSLTAICQQLEFSPYIADYISVLRLENRDVVFTDNDTANSYIKELYIDTADVSDEILATVAIVRIYNGYAGNRHGITLCDAGGNVLFSLYNTTSDSALQLVSKSGVVLDYRTLGSSGYREYTASIIGRNVRNIELSPTIKYSITCEQFTRFTTNDELNSYIKELYITDIVNDATLQSVAYAAIQNGYSGLYGIVFRDSENNAISELEFRRTAGTVNEVRHNNANYNDSMAVLDYRGMSSSSSKTFPCSLIIRNVRNLSVSPYINSYYNESYRHKYYDSSLAVPSLSSLNQGRPVMYEADTKSNSNYVVNAVAYPDGSFIVCRSGGVVAKVDNDGTETTLMTISGATDWRLCWMDKDLNVYVSPHGSVSPGSLSVSDRGLYKLAYGESSFVKVIKLYDTTSEITTETQNNDDTIWTMCQDNNGYLYAGVYAHSVRNNPAIYKSTDGGSTWTYTYNFATSGLASSGKHIHDIIFNEYDNTLYVMVGEMNQIFFSTDGASTFSSARIVLEQDKGTVMLPVKDGLVCGSDGGYKCIISKAYFNFKSSPTFQRYEVKSVCTIWANVVFALRKSDVTGNIYAFTRIDSSVNVSAYYPPVSAISDPSALATWKATSPTYLAQWESYNTYAQDKFPDDAIRPQHFAILVSEDDGDTWKILKVFDTSSNPRGFITCGQFRNGECVCGIVGDPNGYIVKPVVVSEGRHKYGTNGLDLDGEIFVKLNTTSVVTPI